MKITNIDILQTKKGDPYKACTLDNNQKFSVFKFHTRYHEVEVGLEIEPNELEQNGQYWNLVDTAKVAKGVTKDSKMNAMVEKKQEGIRASQEHKDESIKTSSTARDASLFVTSMHPELAGDTEAMQAKWLEWREWLKNNW